MNKGVLLATMIAYGFSGNVGPMGGEDPDLNENELVLSSQLPGCGYRFNDDGSVDCFYPDEDDMIHSLIVDLGYTMEEAQDEVYNPIHYNSVLDLFHSDDGWFLYFIEDNPELYKAIKIILEMEDD